MRCAQYNRHLEYHIYGLVSFCNKIFKDYSNDGIIKRKHQVGDGTCPMLRFGLANKLFHLQNNI